MIINAENVFPCIDIDLPLKISLCYNTSLIQATEIHKNDPIYKLISKYQDIENIQKMIDVKITQFLYFNKEIVHRVLYDSNKIINFEYDENNNNLSFYFYLLLLITDIPYIINYTFSPKYIKNINNLRMDKKLKTIIISKIIIELTKELKNTYDLTGDENENKINDNINNNKKIIENNINYFKELEINMTIEDFCELKLEKIYIIIINALIIKKKFEDYNYTNNIIEQLDLKNIKLTKTMFEELNEIFNSNKSYINDYLITKEEDFSNKNIINFYFILFKYILKSSIYIYQIPFLIKNKKNINKIIIKQKIITSQIEDKDIQVRTEYIIKVFTNSNQNFKKKENKFKFNFIIEKYHNKNQSKNNIETKKEKNEKEN